MKRKVIICSIVFSIFLIAFANVSVFAANIGIVNFKAIDSNGAKVSNLEVNIYKVADIDLPNTNATEEFKYFDIEDISDVNIKKMQDYAEKNIDAILTKTTDANGEFTLKLDTGKYLVVQNNKKEDCIMQTMYVSLPEVMPNNINYNVTVKPKIAIIEKNKDVLNPEEDTLPNTGVLDWPIAVLAVSGIAIFSISWVLFYTKKKIK